MPLFTLILGFHQTEKILEGNRIPVSHQTCWIYFLMQVNLPNGLKVDIGSTFIMITPSAADFNQVTGLCGNFNGNKDDEFVGPDGTQHSNTCDFLLHKKFCVVNKYGLTWK